MGSLQPYRDYKEAHIEWLGTIPVHWRTQRAKNLINKMERSVRPTDEVVTCFRDGVVTLRKNRRTEGFTESLQEIGYQGIRVGDLVVHTMDAFAGAVGVSDSNGKGTPVYSVCTTQAHANAHYYAAVIREMARAQWIAALATGIRERSTDFRYTTLTVQQLPLPPLDEQSTIVRYLDYVSDRINRYIRAKQRLITLLEEQRQAVVHQAVTRGLKPEVRLKPSGVPWLGKVPAHWGIQRAKNLFNKMERPVGPTDDVVTCFRDGVVTLRKNRRTEGFTESLQEIGYQGICVGDLVVHTMDAFAGAVGVSDSNGKGTPVYSVCTTQAHANAHYYAAVIREMARAQWIAALATGIRERSTDFRYTTLAVQQMPLPPVDEQESIARFLNETEARFYTVIRNARVQLSLLQEYRNRFIADAVTGQLDVREAAAELL